MLYPVLQEIEKKCPDKTALQIKREGVYIKYTYQEVIQRAKSIAAFLQKRNIVKKHVALWGESIPEWVIAYLGIHFAGAIVVPLDPQLSTSVVGNFLKFCEAKLIVCSSAIVDKAEKLENLEVLTLEPEGPKSIFSCEVNNDFIPHKMQPEDTMSLLFTSGTTGDPKGVMLSCQNFIAAGKGCIEVCEGRPEEVFLCVLPLHHCYAFTSTIIGPILLGASVTFQPILQGPLIINALQETQVSFMPGVPQLFAAFDRAIFTKINSESWLKRCLFHIFYKIASIARKTFGLNLGKLFFGQIHKRFGTNFRFFMSGGAKLDPEIGERFWNLGIPIIEGYGLTETAPVISVAPLYKYYPGTVGKPLPCLEVRISNPDASGVGEITMRGPTLMKGYYKNEKATAEVVKDGWFYTGDLGYFAKNGLLYITGRAKEVIVLSSGKNIYPDEVEKAYQTSPCVGEICVMADENAERLTAIVVPDFEEIKQRKPPSIYEEIKFQIEKANLSLPSYARVSSFKITTDPFPRTSLGKLQRKKISQREVEEYQEKPIKAKSLSVEDRELLAKAGSELLLQKISDLAKFKDDILPSHSLELDIGLESIKFLELLSILQGEFGIKFPPGEVPAFTHVRDILKALPDSDIPDGKTSSFSWKEFLLQENTPPLDQMFNFKRGFVKKSAIALLRFIIKPMLRIFFGGQNRGFDTLKKHQGPMIIAPMHQSYLDPLLLFHHLPAGVLDKTMFTAMDLIFDKWPMSKTTGIFRIIKTASTTSSLHSMKYIAEALRKERCVCIFPEGLRSSDGSIRDPLIGMGILACELQATVYPIHIEGAMAAYSRTNPGFHLSNIKFSVLDPIVPPKKETFIDEDYWQIVHTWKAAISANKSGS